MQHSSNALIKITPDFSGSMLKIIAIISMVIDHTAYFLMDDGTPLYEAMRCVGRIAFPVFAFLIAEGFRHTKSREKYLLTLLIFAMISEVPWYLLNGNDGTHNVMFTLSLGVIALVFFEKFKSYPILCSGLILAIANIATVLGLDYEGCGVLVIVLFYMFGSIKHYPTHLCRLAQILFTFPIMMHYGTTGAILAMFVLLTYDGTRGMIKGTLSKYAFYAFYPLHLLFIFVIKHFYVP